uniref:Uncharacterized protein n=1 Tax=Arundo donax TaxID=35708 RepID=A0A0A9B4Q9_ARUDO
MWATLLTVTCKSFCMDMLLEIRKMAS